jgi:hypothetical protein
LSCIAFLVLLLIFLQYCSSFRVVETLFMLLQLLSHNALPTLCVAALCVVLLACSCFVRCFFACCYLVWCPSCAILFSCTLGTYLMHPQTPWWTQLQVQRWK